MDGTVTINGNDHDFGKSFSDLWDSLDFAAGLLGIVRHDRWVVRGQIDYASLDSDNENSSAPARLEVDQLCAVAAAGYEVQVAEGVALDVMVGVRYGELDNKVTIKPIGQIESNDVESTETSP